MAEAECRLLTLPMTMYLEMPWYAKANTVNNPTRSTWHYHSWFEKKLFKWNMLCNIWMQKQLSVLQCYAENVSNGPWFLCLGPIHTHLHQQLPGSSPHWGKSQSAVHRFNINTARIRAFLKYPPWLCLWLGHLGNSRHFEWWCFIGRTSEVARCLILTYWFHFARHTGSKSSLAELHNLQQMG